MNSKSIFVFSFLLITFIFFFISSCTSPTEKLYITKCSKCHGVNGTGKSAPINFTRQKFSEEEIRHSILHGKGEMEKILGTQEPELTKLVKYVTSFYQE